MPTGLPLHQHREAAESFGSESGRYDRTRPPYPQALIDRITATSPGHDVLDVGCGTGTAARQFRAAGCAVLGVEPDPRMAEFARRGGLTVEIATFEEWDPGDQKFDAVVAGTAWHWIDPVAGATKAARVLRPGGRLAPFWHVFQLPDELIDAFTAAYHRVVPDSPFDVARMKNALSDYDALLAPAADGIRAAGAFTEPEQWRLDWERSYTRDEWLEQMPTSGGLTRLPPDKLAEVLDAVGAAIDARGGSFTMPYATVALTTTRTNTR